MVPPDPPPLLFQRRQFPAGPAMVLVVGINGCVQGARISQHKPGRHPRSLGQHVVVLDTRGPAPAAAPGRRELETPWRTWHIPPRRQETLEEIRAELEESLRLAGCADLAATAGIVSPDRGFSA